MHEFWKIPIVNIMSTRLQVYTNLVVGEHEIQTFEVVVVSFVVVVWCFCPQFLWGTSLIIFWQMVCANILKCQFMWSNIYSTKVKNDMHNIFPMSMTLDNDIGWAPLVVHLVGISQYLVWGENDQGNQLQLRSRF